MAKCRHTFFGALGQETEEQMKLARNKIRLDLQLLNLSGKDTRI